MNNNLLTGSVMLETMWTIRQKDLLDLISPFVYYAVAKVCSPSEEIDIERTLEIVRTEFGYIDMPSTVIERVLKRNTKYFKRKNGAYYLQPALDNVISEIDKRKEECELKVQQIGDQLADYLCNHVKSLKNIDSEAAIQELQRFFSQYGVFLGINRLEEQTSNIKNREVDYYIAQFLYEKRDKKEIEFDYVIDLVKGYFLQSAIYLQAGNGSLKTATYKNVSFYYDTPFLLRLLGYKNVEDEKSSNELHRALARQRGRFLYFPQTQNEISGILDAYQRGLGRSTYYTLEGLDEKKYTYDSVERLKKTWESRLQSSYNTNLAERPDYPQKSDGSVNENYVINEDELSEVLTKNIYWGTHDALEADMESLLGIHKLREGIKSSEIEHCKAVFVTTNTNLARTFNKYYRENVDSSVFPLVITDTDLAALTWIKCGSTGDLPERLLLRNAFMAMQPAPEIIEKFGHILNQMQSEGSITPDVAIVLRSSGFVKKEILFASFGGDSEINEDLISQLEKKLREESSAAAREDERQKAEREKQDEEHARLSNAYKKARLAASQAMDKQLVRERRIVYVVGIILIILAIAGIIVSSISAYPVSIIITIVLVVSAAFSIVGIIDTAKEKEKLIYRCLVKRANRKYDKVYDELSQEYVAIALGAKRIEG